MKKSLENQILEKLTSIEQRLTKLEAVAHPQSVMADPDLTKMIKRLFEEKPLSSPRARYCDPGSIKLC